MVQMKTRAEQINTTRPKPEQPAKNEENGSDSCGLRVQDLFLSVTRGFYWAGAGVEIPTHRHSGPTEKAAVTYY
jgi:hypothetical protein